MKRISWRAVVILVVLVTAFIYLLPTIKPSLWPYKKINLGLDLQGGMHLILEVDADKAVENTIERIAQELRTALRKERIRYDDLERVDDIKLIVNVNGAENIEALEKLLDSEFKGLRLARLQTGEQLAVTLDLPDNETTHIKKMAVEQALETIRNRIDQFGVSEPDIRNQGEKRILIQLPGITDTQRAKELIGRTA